MGMLADEYHGIKKVITLLMRLSFPFTPSNLSRFACQDPTSNIFFPK